MTVIAFFGELESPLQLCCHRPQTPQQRHHQDLHSSELETYAQMFLIICVLNAPYAAKAWLGYKMGARECAERKGALLHTNLQL